MSSFRRGFKEPALERVVLMVLGVERQRLVLIAFGHDLGVIDSRHECHPTGDIAQ